MAWEMNKLFCLPYTTLCLLLLGLGSCQDKYHRVVDMSVYEDCPVNLQYWNLDLNEYSDAEAELIYKQRVCQLAQFEEKVLRPLQGSHIDSVCEILKKDCEQINFYSFSFEDWPRTKIYFTSKGFFPYVRRNFHFIAHHRRGGLSLDDNLYKSLILIYQDDILVHYCVKDLDPRDAYNLAAKEWPSPFPFGW